MSASGLHAHVVVDREPGFSLQLEMTIPPGQTLALLGPNGAGKSSALEAVAGLLPLAGGRIELDGRVLDDPEQGIFVPSHERRMGVVLQDGVLFPHLSVRNNVAFGPRSRWGGRRADEATEYWLRALSLEDLASRAPDDLSGGQAQRVALARALATEPRMLLLDEPFSALDVGARAAMRRTVQQHVAAFEGPRLLVTHDPSEAYVLADQILIVEAGRAVQQGTPEEVRRRPANAFAAALARSNLVRGTADAGYVRVGDHRLRIADSSVSGPVLITVRASAVALHAARPEGSPRNAWRTQIEHLEPEGERVRVLVGPPLPLTVEITREAMVALGLAEGASLWLTIKATDIGVSPLSGRGEDAEA